VRSGSLCTGIMGLDRAAADVYGCDLAWYSELEPAPCQIIQREHPDVPNLGDLTALDWSELEPVDVLTAGYPCQPFSHAGKRKGASDVRHLWPYIAEAVRVLRPRRVVLENVAGHLSLGFGDVLRDLAEAGFDAEWCVLRASDVGACHQRARLFIVAADADRASAARHGQYGGPSPEASTGLRVGAAERSPAPAPYPGGERHGGGQVPAPADAADLGHERARAARGRGDGPADSGDAATDAPHDGHEGDRLPVAGGCAPRGDRRGEPGGEDRDPVPAVAWGAYEPAILRWEAVLGRPAPAPTDDSGRLSPAFVEWMQGYPEGWVDGLTRTQALKALGNAVVPQQGAAAIRLLEDALAHLAVAA
jgi:DNA (cytosine-5)-methyltransferase 1